MIIDGNDQRTGAVDTGDFTLVSANGALELSVRLTGALCDDFRDHLTAQGFLVPDGAARSVVSEVVVAVAANPAAWAALGGTLVAFLGRHRGKVHRFEVEGKSISIEGYSARQAKRIAADLLGLSRERGNPEKRLGAGSDGQ